MEHTIRPTQKLTAADAHDNVVTNWDMALTGKEPEVDTGSQLQWLNMWGRLTYVVAGFGDFPIWVQMLPNTFFDVIDLDREWRASVVHSPGSAVAFKTRG